MIPNTLPSGTGLYLARKYLLKMGRGIRDREEEVKKGKIDSKRKKIKNKSFANGEGKGL